MSFPIQHDLQHLLFS